MNREMCHVVLCYYRFGKLAGQVRWVEDLIVENREIERKSKTDWVCGLHFRFADFKGLFIGSLRVFYDLWGKKNQNL